MIVHRAAARIAATVALIAAMASCGTGSNDSVAQQAPAAGVVPVAALNASNAVTDGDARGPACALRDVALSLGEDRSGGHTGQHSISLRFTNDGEESCALDGRPSVEFLDADDRSVLREDDNGAGRQYVHRTGTSAIQLQPGGSAEVVIAKYRCDLGDEVAATQVKVGLPGAGAAATLATDSDLVGGFSSCRGGEEDPGQTFAISGYTPFECHMVGNSTGGGWCDGDLGRPNTQTLEEAERAAHKEELARQHGHAKTG